MTDTTTTELYLLSPGDTFSHRDKRYVLTGFNRTRANISTLDPKPRHFVLSGTARVQPLGKDMDALSRALSDRGDLTPRLRPGTKVRIKDNAQTRKAGIAGVESVILRVNAKSYGLANEYRVSPGLVEEVTP